MRVFICKFSNENKIESRVYRLVSSERKRTGQKTRIFCNDDITQQKLLSAGIMSAVFHDLKNHYGSDAAGWEKVYRLSDELYSVADTYEKLKYHGINFFNLEYNVAGYVLISEFVNLYKQMMEEDCETLFLILTKSYVQWFPDINKSGIRTIYFREMERILVTKARNLYRILIDVAKALLLHAFIFITVHNKQTIDNGMAIPTQRNSKELSKALFVVSGALYARPAMSVFSTCIPENITPNIVTDDDIVIAMLKGTYLVKSGFSLRIRYLSRVLPWHRLKVQKLYLRLKNTVELISKNKVTAGSPDQFYEHISLSVLLRDLPGLCSYTVSVIDFLEKQIKMFSPDIICLMPDGYYLQQIAAALAKKYGIPTLACSAALENGNSHSYMGHLHADKLAAMGEVIKHIYIQSGIKPERIAVTGVAHFDRLFTRDPAQDDKVLRGYGINTDKKIIVFGTENLSVSETVEALNGVISAILKMKDTQLVVKVHPGESVAPYRATVDRYHESSIIVSKDIDLHTLLNRCELLIVKFSTIALEAMMIDKPVVVINLSGQPVPVPYAEEGAAIGVYRYADIEPAITKALYDEEAKAKYKAGRAKFVRAWAGEPDGKASQRIVNLMKEMIKSSKIGEGEYATN